MGDRKLVARGRDGAEEPDTSSTGIADENWIQAIEQGELIISWDGSSEAVQELQEARSPWRFK